MLSFLLMSPQNQLPDFVFQQHVSQSHECSKSVWQQSLSTIIGKSFEPVDPFSVLQPENSPLPKLHATSLSSCKCSVNQSPRMGIVVSAGPKSLGVLSSTFFPSLLPLSFFMSNRTIRSSKDERDELVHLLKNIFPYSCSHPLFACPSGAILSHTYFLRFVRAERANHL